jgi:hypothetical protein
VTAAHDGGRDIVACLDRWLRDSFPFGDCAVDQSASGALEDREALRRDETRPQGRGGAAASDGEGRGAGVFMAAA